VEGSFFSINKVRRRPLPSRALNDSFQGSLLFKRRSGKWQGRPRTALHQTMARGTQLGKEVKRSSSGVPALMEEWQVRRAIGRFEFGRRSLRHASLFLPGRQSWLRLKWVEMSDGKW
jgi:hypothetical protein